MRESPIDTQRHSSIRHTRMLSKIQFLLCLKVLTVAANLEGPFLFFGPKHLESFRRPALTSIDQDELVRIYGEQEAIVVFNNQDSVPLSSGYFPRLRRMLEGQSTLVLPQDFLDVHPDYISNETQVLTLQGPWSERDAQMTETFARLQDIYGAGRVLGILGNSVSSPADTEWSRRRRAADATTTPDAEERPARADAEERPARVPLKYALYNATAGPGKSAMLHSSSWPRLRWADGSETVLSAPIGEATVRSTRLYTMLVVRFADGDNYRDKITLEFNFKQSAGWWVALGVEVKRGKQTVNLQAPAAPRAPTAMLGKSYHCDLKVVYTGENASLTMRDITIQAYMKGTEEFDDSINCIGYMTVPILSGLMVSVSMLAVLFLSIILMLDIKTMDKFENTRSKQLTITVSE